MLLLCGGPTAGVYLRLPEAPKCNTAGLCGTWVVHVTSSQASKHLDRLRHVCTCLNNSGIKCMVLCI